jgi:hypothetical protein
MMKEVSIACRMLTKVKPINGSSLWMELSAVSHQLSAKPLFLIFFDEY